MIRKIVLLSVGFFLPFVIVGGFLFLRDGTLAPHSGFETHEHTDDIDHTTSDHTHDDGFIIPDGWKLQTTDEWRLILPMNLVRQEQTVPDQPVSFHDPKSNISMQIMNSSSAQLFHEDPGIHCIYSEDAHAYSAVNPTDPCHSVRHDDTEETDLFTLSFLDEDISILFVSVVIDSTHFVFKDIVGPLEQKDETIQARNLELLNTAEIMAQQSATR